MMHTPVATIPRFTIGRASEMLFRRESDAEVTNVAVRIEDRVAFLGVISMREAQIAAPAKFAGLVDAVEVARYAEAAKEAISSGCPPELAIANLEACAAYAISLLTDLQGKS